jgi:hypothetical protein
MAEISTVATEPAVAPKSPYGGKTLAWIFMIVAGVTTMYWMMWFAIPGGRDTLAVLPKDHTYLTFENAFPVSDGWMSLCSLVAAIQLFRAKSSAIPWVFMGGSAGLYLGGMDISYDVQNGIYQLLSQNAGSVVTEMIINVASVGISIGALWWAAKHRDWQCKD